MLSDEELVDINGGGVKWFAYGFLVAVVSFIAGILDGYFRPLKCNE